MDSLLGCSPLAYNRSFWAQPAAVETNAFSNSLTRSGGSPWYPRISPPLARAPVAYFSSVFTVLSDVPDAVNAECASELTGWALLISTVSSFFPSELTFWRRRELQQKLLHRYKNSRRWNWHGIGQFSLTICTAILTSRGRSHGNRLGIISWAF